MELPQFSKSREQKEAFLLLEIEEFIEKEEVEVISFHFNLFPLDFQPRLNYDRYSFFPEQLMDVI